MDTPTDTSSGNDQQQVLVWDRFVRLFHWSLVGLVSATYITGEIGIEAAHYLLGYLLVPLIAARLVWGFIGSRYARFSSFVFAPRTVLRYLLAILRGHPARYLGHNPAGGAMVVLLLALLLVIVASGLITQATIEFEGPLYAALWTVDDRFAHTARALHHLSTHLLLPLVVLHVGGVVVASVQHHESLVGAMVHGKKSIPGSPS